MPRRAEPDIYVTKTQFWVELEGVPTLIARGERVRKGHSLLRSHPEYFEPVDRDVKYDIEQATAAPGERRER